MDGSEFASCSDDKTIKIWSQNFPAESNSQPFVQHWCSSGSIDGYHTRSIFALDWSRDGIIATGCGDNCIRVFIQGNSTRSSKSKHRNLLWELGTTVPNAHDGDITSLQW